MDTNPTLIFTEIYKKDLWTNGSGPGSLPKNVLTYLDFLKEFIVEKQVKSILDIGCGDWQFTKMLNLSGICYLGVDVVDEVIQKNNEIYARDGINFMFIDDNYIPDKKYDVVVIKDVLQHLSFKFCQKMISNLDGYYKYLVITNDFCEENKDCQNGSWRPLNLTLPPFNLSTVREFKFKSIPFTKHTIIIENV